MSDILMKGLYLGFDALCTLCMISIGCISLGVGIGVILSMTMLKGHYKFTVTNEDPQTTVFKLNPEPEENDSTKVD